MGTNCSAGQPTLDPYQSILDASNTAISTLERQRNIIKPFIDAFSVAAGITPATPSGLFNAAVNQYTAEAICAASTDLAPINNFVGDCLNEAARAVKKFLRDILSIIQKGINLIGSLLGLPENFLLNLFQKIWSLVDGIKGLITGVDFKLKCVSPASYKDQVDDLNDRVNGVITDLKLGDDGSFDSDVLLDGVNEDLKNNIKSYETRAQNLRQEIIDNVTNTVDLTTTVNPKRFF
jgi:hypothetical protein